MKLVTEYFDSVKVTIEQDIKMSEEVLRNVVSNYKSSDFMRSANEIKVSLLNKGILQRKEVQISRKIELIISGLIKDVDEKFQRRQKDGPDVVKELESMEQILKSQVKTMKEQHKNLSLENVAQTSPQITEWKKDVPKYCDDLNFHLLFDHVKQTVNLEM